ncbi:MAG: tetratricopeptide repeat protein [Cyclobacteriaceae bacterium]
MFIRSFLILMLGFGLSVSLKSQSAEIDSLESLLRQHKVQDSRYVEYLHQLSFLYRQLNTDTSLWLANRSLAIADSLGDELGMAWALNRVSSAYWMKGKYPEALKFSYEALEIFEALEDIVGIAQSYNSIANTYNMEGEHHKALEFYDKSIEKYEVLEDEFNINRAYSNIGRTYYMMGQNEQGLTYIRRVIDALIDNKQHFMYPIARNTEGDILQAQRQWNNALTSYQEAYRITQAINNPRVMTYSTRGMSEIYRELNDLLRSNEFALETLTISEEMGYLENVKNASKILSENYEQLGNNKLALKYYKQYSDTKDQMFNDSKERELTALKESFEISQQAKEIELLTIQGQAQEQESQKQKVIMYSLIIVLVLIAILVFSLYLTNREKTRINSVLRKQKEELSNKNIEILKQREEILEQSRKLDLANKTKDKMFSIVSHDLRSPMHSLLGFVEVLDRIGEFPANQLARIRQEMKMKLQSLSELVNNLLHWSQQQFKGVELSPDRISVKEIIHRNANALAIVADLKDVKIEVEERDDLAGFADPGQASSIVRNLIGNAIKFSNPGDSVKVSYQAKGKFIQVSVADKGVGMSDERLDSLFSEEPMETQMGTSKETGTGLGLRICKELTEANGGEIWAESELEVGSVFHFTVPLAKLKS